MSGICAALTSLQLLDDSVATDGSAALTKLIQVGGTDGTNAQILSTNTSGHLNIADGGNSITVDGTVAATQSGTWTVQPGNTANTTPWRIRPSDGTNDVSIKAASTAAVAADPALVVAVSPNNSVAVVQSTPSNFLNKPYGAVTTNAPTYTTSTDQPLSLTTAGGLRVAVTEALPAGTNAIGKLSANSGVIIGAVEIAAAQTLATVTTVSTVTSLSQLAGQAINLGAGTTGTGTLRVVEASSSTGTQDNPSLSTTSATVLAANTARRGATVFNGSTSIVYLRLSATAASTTTYTIKLNPDDYYEVPSYYNGAITGILNTGSTTLVQVTEIT